MKLYQFALIWIAVFTISVFGLAYIHELKNQQILIAYGVKSKIVLFPYGFNMSVDRLWNDTKGIALTGTVANESQIDEMYQNNSPEYFKIISLIQVNENYVNNDNEFFYSGLVAWLVAGFFYWHSKRKLVNPPISGHSSPNSENISIPSWGAA